jgi:hypothetical protein
MQTVQRHRLHLLLGRLEYNYVRYVVGCVASMVFVRVGRARVSIRTGEHSDR